MFTCTEPAAFSSATAAVTRPAPGWLVPAGVLVAGLPLAGVLSGRALAALPPETVPPEARAPAEARLAGLLPPAVQPVTIVTIAATAATRDIAPTRGIGRVRIWTWIPAHRTLISYIIEP
jgi:hypothetical protein